MTGRAGLEKAHVDPNPFAQLRGWLDDAAAAKVVEPAAMALATVSADAQPSVRMVLLRGCDERGLAFFTNYESAKGRDLSARPVAAVAFYWGVLERQVRVEGSVERLEPHESDAYFASRPRGHQLSAWASAQSSVVADRAFLEARAAEARERYAGRDVERPPHWGGYRIVPVRFEFWQGRPDRLHDRIVYAHAPSGWRIVRLSP